MKIDKNHIYIPADKTNYGLFKYQLSGTWSAKHHAWRFPKSVFALDELARHLPELAKTDVFQTGYNMLKEGRERLKNLKNSDPPISLDHRLRPYQLQDIHYLTSIPNAGVFNQPRTGKTPTIIQAIYARGAKRNVVITPASLQYNWKKEIESWHPGSIVYMYAGTPKQREKVLKQFMNVCQDQVGYLLMSKDTAKRDVDQLTFKHDACVVDEAHYLRNDDTLQTKAVYTIGKQANHRYALTGTPTVKHPSDVFGILKFLYPEKFTSYWGFVERYFEIADNGFGKEIKEPIKHRVDELQDMIDAVSTQRLRKNVMEWLPDKTYHTHICTMSTKQEKIYRQMAEDFVAAYDDVEIDTSNVLAQLMRLRQICLDPSLIGFNVPSVKTDIILEAIENKTYDEPLIIMSMFTSYLKMLRPMIEKLGKRVGMIHGDMTNKEKDDAARAFQDGKLDILLCNIISAGTGFTLDRGEVIIFTDKAWNPSDNEQAEDRITPTQKDRVHKHFVVSMIVEGSVEEKIEHLLNKKQSLTSLINEAKSWKEIKKFLFTF